MALSRADSARTMASRAWSTTDLTKGLESLLGGGSQDNDLPDSLEKLEEQINSTGCTHEHVGT